MISATNVEALFLEIRALFMDAGLYYGHGTGNAQDEVAWLMMHVMGLDLMHDQLMPEKMLDAQTVEKIHNLANKRVQSRVPLAYLINSAWFCGLEFYVDERVIIPRSPVAELIDNAFRPWISKTPDSILDLCTGSACIAVACAQQFESAQVDATDISSDALEVAQLNIDRHQLGDRVHLVQADVFNGLPLRQYDLIISNPPYVGADEMLALPTEYKHEPELALVAGTDGLDIVRQILNRVLDYLAPGGLLVCEVGNSEQAVSHCWPQVPFIWLEFERGGQGVFLISAEELSTYRDVFVLE